MATSLSKSGLVFAPVHTARLGIAEATRRPRELERHCANTWGYSKVTGKIGQQHIDLLDYMGHIAEMKIVDGSGQLNLLIDSSKLRAALGWNKITYGQIEQQIEDLRKAKVEVFVRRSGMDIRAVGGIVSEYLMADKNKTQSSKTSHLKGSDDFGRGLSLHAGYWKIVFSAAWTGMLLNDLQYWYPLAEVLFLNP
ncbi:hypothetical protein THIX_60976 [Thiomonas sp. X19]|uniref:hypothetical protein n=1 Tax=Thiomonas sp. X19 TaxID=1050370 RepID=UPI000B73C141|nr:hypothetical protein [Thiomonas sp. X19]SCC94918.1 hypothetical protein THIX_60976 [Thiomonas sp. X19]